MSDRVLPPRPASLGIASSPAVPPPPVPERKVSLNHLQKGASSSSVSTSSSMADLPEDYNPMFMFTAKKLPEDTFKAMHDFYRSKFLCDVEISVGKKTIQCHKIVLCSFSGYFKGMFASDMSESRETVVTIKDIDEDALEKLINFAYTSNIHLTIDDVQSLLYASSILQVETVAQACCEFMKTHLHPTNCIGIRNFAYEHGRLALTQKADLFIEEHFVNVTESEEFVTMPHDQLLNLIKSSNLNVTNEIEIYEAVLKWVKHDLNERKVFLPEFMSYIRLSQLPPKYLIETVEKDENIRRDHACRDWVDAAKSLQLSIHGVIPEMVPTERDRPRKSYAGVIFCVGGRGAAGDPFKSIECYDLRKDKWFQVAEMSCRRRHVGVVSVKGKLYAIGGHDGTEHLSSGEMFDPATNKWKPIAPMGTLRRGIALACLGGPIYAVGGLDDTCCFNSVERYDLETNTWSSVQAMHVPRGGVAVAALGKYLFAVGGNDGATSLESCERYDPHLNKWTNVCVMNKRRAGAGVAELNGLLYVVGGFDDNAPLDSVEKYDPGKDQWSMVSSMSCPRGGVGVATLAGRLYAVGGHDGSNYLNSVEAYDPITNDWSHAATIGTCRAGAGIALVECRITDLKDILSASYVPTTAGHL